MKKPNPSEPNFSTACDWWPDLPNIWTPLGWREHMFRFNVLWNGTILAQPHTNRRAPSTVLLHVPSVVKYVSVDGKPQRPKKGVIDLSS